MKIGIIDADLMDNGTRHPNLALMKISGYYKEKGHDVKLIYNSYMEIYEYDKKFFSEYPNFTYNRASLRLSERGQQNLCSRREKFRKRSGIGFAKRIFELL